MTRRLIAACVAALAVAVSTVVGDALLRTNVDARVCLYVAVQVIARSAAFRRTLVKL